MWREASSAGLAGYRDNARACAPSIAARARHVGRRPHEAALALARDHRLSFYDALIVAAAQEAGCDTLYTEDMQHGRKFGGLVIVNPFVEGGG